MNNLWNRSINSATSNAYLSGYKCLCKFIHSHFPATDMHYILCNITEDVFIYFVSHCYSVLKLKYSTIKFYLAGVCHFSLSIFNHNPLIDTYCRFKASKTDVFQKGVIIKLFKTDKTICPYKQLTRYIDYR